MTRARTLHRADAGATSVEYALLVVAIAAVIVAVVFVLGTLTRNNFSGTCSAWNAAASTAGSC